MDLKEIKDKIDFYQKEKDLAAKENSKLEGVKESLIEHLEKQFSISSKQDIIDLIDKFKKRREIIFEKLCIKLKDLDDNYK